MRFVVIAKIRLKGIPISYTAEGPKKKSMSQEFGSIRTALGANRRLERCTIVSNSKSTSKSMSHIIFRYYNMASVN